METTIEQQVALDEALVPSTQRLRIGRSNFRLPSDIQSKESTLQVVYGVLRRCPFFKAFLVTADPWRSFGAVINKCLTGKSFGFDSFRLSQAQILWGLYHNRNIDYAFLIWEDFVYQVKYKNQKKSNEMYYLRFTKVIIHHFMSKDLSILRRNKVNWHYVRDDIIFSTIKVVYRHQNTQQYGAVLLIELTNEKIRNTKAYKEYYACATGEAAPKPKASARRKISGSDTSITPPTAITTLTTTVAVTPRLTAAAKGKQPAKAKSPSDPSELARIEAQQLKIILRRSRQETDDDEGDEKDESDDREEDDDDERDDDEKEIAKTDGQDDAERGEDDDEKTESDEKSDGDETRKEEKEEADELYRDVDLNQGRGLQLSQDIEDSYVTLTLVLSDGQQESSSVSSQFLSNMLNPTSDVAGSESRPPMLNKENYVPWSSRLLRYAKSRPNGKLIHNSILNGPYEIWLRVQQMMKGYDIGIQEKKAKLFNEWERFTSNEGELIESYYHRFLKL
nr:hypothetical protein [Tanacetum cinerariifolium]